MGVLLSSGSFVKASFSFGKVCREIMGGPGDTRESQFAKYEKHEQLCGSKCELVHKAKAYYGSKCKKIITFCGPEDFVSVADMLREKTPKEIFDPIQEHSHPWLTTCDYNNGLFDDANCCKIVTRFPETKLNFGQDLSDLADYFQKNHDYHGIRRLEEEEDAKLVVANKYKLLKKLKMQRDMGF